MKKRKSNGKVDKMAVKKYVDSQMKIMKKYGTTLSGRQYKRLISKVSQAVAS